MRTKIIISGGKIDWNALADLYREAKTQDERDRAFEAIEQAIAADKELPDDTDFKAGAEEFLRGRGLL